jgi:hypothetical protein
MTQHCDAHGHVVDEAEALDARGISMRVPLSVGPARHPTPRRWPSPVLARHPRSAARGNRQGGLVPTGEQCGRVLSQGNQSLRE